MKTKNLGAVTAYADAVKQGYKGTREEFGKVMADFADTARQVEADAQEVRENKTGIEDMHATIQALQEQAAESAQAAEQSNAEAAGHAGAAEASRQAAAEAESNVNARANSFDEHVTSKTTEAAEAITAAKQAATDAISAQQAESIQAVRDEATQFIAAKQTETEKSIQDKAAEYATNVDADITAVNTAGQNQVQAVTDVGKSQVNAINTAGQTQTERIQTAGTDAVTDINVAGAEQTKAVNDAGEARLKEVNDAGTAQKQAVETAGETQTAAVNAAGTAQVTSVQNEGTAQVKNVQDAAAEIIADRDQIDINRQNILKTAIKSTASGSPITISDSADMPLVGLREYGWTKQERTTGAQLLDIPAKVKADSEFYTINPDGSINLIKTDSRTLSEMPISQRLPAGSYTVSAGDNETRVEIYDHSSGIKIIDTTGGAIKFTLNNETDISWKTSLNGGKKNNMKIMLNSGSTALQWEPYTGGKPSPSPDYPQELVSAGDKGSVETRVTGRNLVNLPDIEDTVVNGITWSCKNGIVKAKGTANQTSVTSSIKINVIPGTYFVSGSMGEIKFYCRVTAQDGTEKYHSNQSFTLNGTEKEAVLYCQVYNGMTVDGVVYPMLNLGDIALPWEPYTLQSLPHATPNGFPGIPVTSGGNYTDAAGQQWIADYRDWERGVDVQRVRHITFDGTESWSHLLTANNNNNFQIKVKINDENVAATVGNCMSNYLPYKNTSWDDSINKLPKIYAYMNEITVSFPPDSQFNSLDVWTNWLKENRDFEFIYVLATPIETPIPPEELAAYHAAHTNYPNTVLTNDEGCWMEVEYIADPGNHISQNYVKKDSYTTLEQRVAALEAQIVNNI